MEYVHTKDIGKLTSAVSNGTSSVRPTVEERASVKEVQAAEEEKENKVMSKFPTFPWNFEEASRFSQLQDCIDCCVIGLVCLQFLC